MLRTLEKTLTTQKIEGILALSCEMNIKQLCEVRFEGNVRELWSP